MSRWVYLLLAIIFALSVGSVISCGDDDDDDDDSSSSADDTGDDGSDDDDDDDDDDEADDTVDDDAADDTSDDDTANDDDDDTAAEAVWTDTVSGLTWKVNPPSGGKDWADAKTYCENHAAAGGGWHLPTISELRTLIRGCAGTVTGGSCGVTDECTELTCYDDTCYACNEDEGPNDGCFWPAEVSGSCGWYWSSTEMTETTSDLAWTVTFNDGDVYFDSYYDPNLKVRCVR